MRFHHLLHASVRNECLPSTLIVANSNSTIEEEWANSNIEDGKIINCGTLKIVFIVTNAPHTQTHIFKLQLLKRIMMVSFSFNGKTARHEHDEKRSITVKRRTMKKNCN